MSVVRLPTKKRPEIGAFQAVVEDVFALEGKIERFAVVVWYEGGARLVHVSRDALDGLDELVQEQLYRHYGDEQC